jgi:hypothetical protein
MNKNWGEVTGVDPVKLYKLFEILDDIGVHHEWSEDNGELHIRAGDVWISFLADEQVMADMQADKFAYADAQRVADMYWRE